MNGYWKKTDASHNTVQCVCECGKQHNVHVSFSFHALAARGPKKHLKRLRAPKSWMLDKLGGVYAPRPSTGPHKLRESLPLVVMLRNRLKYALTRDEVTKIVMQRTIKVDGKVRTDINYPAGFMVQIMANIIFDE
ncbi:hypothetical protein BLA29_006959 [Euroglyphus maynei]|uniref:40S ribosomal protein S4 n=1 Tax=Euroglyphus maynei TaxID=6958 RepID=A0A1Y3B9X9_EURMA|nr:hypothetical protein BLA29_006959 [Euroglyphus maynei]